ncbi:hypothetical protein [Saccharothrix xinjiangensis]|uniref:Uncharacterized protein n=1 Tax=Saccharothrix xinjiangensis TaxID=204798 RepID=A0ABV9XWE4_9PSEU
METEADETFLQTLDALVPLRIVELADYPPSARQRLAMETVDTISVQADAITRREHGTDIRSQRRTVLTAIVTGLAIGAYEPGGVNFCGRHWEVRRD